MSVQKTLAGVLVAFALSITSAWAQLGTVRGRVVDDTGAPVADAVIQLEAKGDMPKITTVKTNKKGEFVQVGLYRGPYVFSIKKEGFAPISDRVPVSSGETTEIGDIKLTPLAKAEQAARKSSDMGKAIELAKEGKLDEAEAAFKEIVTKTPGNAMAQHNLGWVYTQKKDWVSAEAAYRKAFELNPENSDTVAALAGALRAQGKQEEALQILTQAAAVQPDNASVQYNLGVVLFNGGKGAEANALFQKVVTLDPTFTEAYYYLGTTAFGLNKLDEAAANLRKYLSMSPTNVQNVETAKGLLTALPKK